MGVTLQNSEVTITCATRQFGPFKTNYLPAKPPQESQYCDVHEYGTHTCDPMELHDIVIAELEISEIEEDCQPITENEHDDDHHWRKLQLFVNHSDKLDDYLLMLFVTLGTEVKIDEESSYNIPFYRAYQEHFDFYLSAECYEQHEKIVI
jgi:hypothetical protein